jgi:tRNA A37 methylthiotransferase MiaB
LGRASKSERREGGARLFQGRTERNEIVHVEHDSGALVGELVAVDVVQANRHSLFGRLVHDLPEKTPRARRTLHVLTA